MRCPICGSKIIYPATDHKQFSGGKAVAGALAFGVVGAAAGFIGKDTKGYRCGACGAFSEETMSMTLEMEIDRAIRTAEQDGDFTAYDIHKKSYANIETVKIERTDSVANTAILQQVTADEEHAIKHTYQPLKHIVGCPVFVESVLVMTKDNSDYLSFVAWNNSTKQLRSVYFDVKVLDDTGDIINECNCVYQSLSVAPGECLPLETKFALNTNVAHKVEFHCTKASFHDDTVWRFDDNKVYGLTAQTTISAGDFPRFKALQSKIVEETKLGLDDTIYQPIFEDDYVQCLCGYPFDLQNGCWHCGASAEKIQEIFSFDVLEAYETDHICKIAEERYNAMDKLVTQVKNDVFEKAKKQIKKNTLESYEEGIALLASIPGWKNADEQIVACQNKIEEMKAQAEAERIEQERKAEEKRLERERQEEQERQEKIRRTKRAKKITGITLSSVAAVTIFLVLLFKLIIPESNYGKASALMESGNYFEASEVFKALGDYKDSKDKSVEALYQQGLVHWNAKQFDDSNKIFEGIMDYKDSKSKIHKHEYTSEVTQAATCAKEGITTFSCKTCDSSYTEPIKLLAHKYAETITVKPTCTTTGKKTLTCKNCKQTKDESIKATGHSHKASITKAATCDTDGTKTLTCHCGDSRTETIKATGHNYSNATCTSPKKCKTCGATTGSTVAHDYADATCSSPKKCKMCGVTSGSVLGHSANSFNQCERCKCNMFPTFTEKVSFHYSYQKEIKYTLDAYDETVFMERDTGALPSGKYKLTVKAENLTLKDGTPADSAYCKIFLASGVCTYFPDEDAIFSLGNFNKAGTYTQEIDLSGFYTPWLYVFLSNVDLTITLEAVN